MSIEEVEIRAEPKVKYLGMIAGEWPIYAFSDDAQALAWIKIEPRRRKVWHVQVKVLEEMKLIVREEHLESMGR